MATVLASQDTDIEQNVDTGNAERVTAQISQVVGFRLGNETYGLDIMRVQEIILMGRITGIPEVPDYVRGVINLRGKVIPIVDLRKRFGFPGSDTNDDTRIMVVNTSATTIGIVVDAVSEVLRINPGEIEPPPMGVIGLDQSYVSGLVKMDDRIMILLDIDGILSVEDRASIETKATEAT